MREIPITQSMKEAINRSNNGEPVNFNDIAVFEARSLNTRPLRRKHGLFAGAHTQPSMLSDMVQYLNSSTEGVPLHIMHNTEMLNAGKVFQARVDKAIDGHDELSAQFYIPRTQAGIISNLNNGVTDQVSVGVQAKEIKCSECGFDYRKGDITNLLLGQCDKGHVIGENGVHTKLHGMDAWSELSLVDRGAANDARIVSAQTSRFKDPAFALAANHNELATLTPLFASFDDISSMEKPQVDEIKLKELLQATLSETNTQNKEALEALQAKLDEANGKVTAAEGARDAAQTQVTALTAQVGTLTSERDAARTEREATVAQLKEAEDYLKDQAKKAQVASGVTAPVEVANFKEAIEKINTSGVNLVNLFARERSATVVKDIQPVVLHGAELRAGLSGFSARRHKEQI